ncbi:hypothetical protein NHH03_19275 [Stieleria sp. TO1_6]|uniref:hypothetical protein n=1 Tax=Stieleria tagensis TaxID=2956795 RepID=UPI00209A9185|nr:hypothetical protein [Stieleria tagensis]MCO8123896.1 hypothetical protein [Stieleria tagensis]
MKLRLGGISTAGATALDQSEDLADSLPRWCMQTGRFSFPIDGLLMRKDVKRSLMIWPLAASAFTIALCWLAIQPDLLSRQWDKLKSHQRVTQSHLIAGKSVSHSSKLAGLSAESGQPQPKSPQTLSLAIDEPVVVGIPAPQLDAQSDLFGFENAVLTTQPPADNSDLAVVSPETEADFEEILDGLARDLTLPPVVDSAAVAVSDLTPRSDDLRRVAVEEQLAVDIDQAWSHPETMASVQSTLTAPIQSRGTQLNPQRQTTTVGSPLPQIDAPVAGSPTTKRSLTSARSATWPVSRRLVEQLRTVEAVAANRRRGDDRISGSGTVATLASAGPDPATAQQMAQWTTEVRTLLEQLPQSRRLGDPSVGEGLAELRRLQQFAAIQAETLQTPSARVAWLQAAYSIERRLAVWQPIYEINSTPDSMVRPVSESVVSVGDAIEQLELQLPATGDADGWSTFLLIDELRDAFHDGDDQQRRELAQVYLSRMTWPNLAPIHQQWIESPPVQAVALAVRPWASGAVDYAALLHQIEKAESNAIDLVTAEIAGSMQALQYADHPQAIQLAKNLDTHYRNANVRFSISDQMLAELLPDLPSRDVPVRTTLLGSRVTGISRIESDLSIQLHPSPSSWELTLHTLGNVATRSIGRRGPAAVSTSSVNPFSASIPISIQPTDIELGDSTVEVDGQSKLHGIDTQYDSWPLVGTLVRSIAESEYWNKASLANRIARNRIRNEVGDEIDRSITEKVDHASSKFSKTVLGPLTNLRLAPQVIDMQTTESRLVARYRMAGDWQLAAMTPRPRAPSTSLLSVQIHQSAINNTLEQLVPQDQPMPIHEMLNECFNLVGVDGMEMPEEMPEDIQIQFAKHRPITIEIEDGKVWLTMRIIRLERERGIKLRNFIVRAAYQPVTDGLTASLERDGHLSISGPGMSMRERLPARAVFNKVLSPNRSLPLTSPEMLAAYVPEQSQVIQFELRDGWIGLAIGQQHPSDRVATGPSQQTPSGKHPVR